MSHAHIRLPNFTLLSSISLPLCVLALCLAATPAQAQSPRFTVVLDPDESRSIADFAASLSIQGPADVNDEPTCQRLGLPCLGQRSAPDFGVALSTTLYPNETVGVIGELSLYGNYWYEFPTDCAAIIKLRSPEACARQRINFARAALGGVKLRTPLIHSSGSRIRLFCQALTGPEWSDVGPVHQVLQPGAGIDTYMRYGVIMHMELDYRFAYGSGARDLSTLRFLIGIGVPIGSR